MCDSSWAGQTAAFGSSLEHAMGKKIDDKDARHSHGNRHGAALVHGGASAPRLHAHPQPGRHPSQTHMYEGSVA